MHRAIIATLVGILFAALPAAAQNPYERPDDTWITLSGTVDIVQPGSFTLDYGDGVVFVEMDHWSSDDSVALSRGDSVTVTGVIDDDLFETTTIEASSVYVQNLNRYFFASPADEEDTFVMVTTPVVVASIVVQGTITGIDGAEFTLDTGQRELTVDVSEMPYDPLDDRGNQKLAVGDRVSVSGMVDEGFFGGRRLAADWIVTLSSQPDSTAMRHSATLPDTLQRPDTTILPDTVLSDSTMIPDTTVTRVP